MSNKYITYSARVEINGIGYGLIPKGDTNRELVTTSYKEIEKACFEWLMKTSFSEYDPVSSKMNCHIFKYNNRNFMMREIKKTLFITLSKERIKEVER